MKTYFKFKTKEEYLPEFIKECIQNDSIIYHGAQIYSIDNQMSRKLKIRNLENKNPDDDDKFLNYMINDSFIHYLTEEEYKKIKESQIYTTNTTTFKSGNGGVGTSSSFNHYSVDYDDDYNYYNSGWSVGVGNITTWK